MNSFAQNLLQKFSVSSQMQEVETLLLKKNHICIKGIVGSMHGLLLARLSNGSMKSKQVVYLSTQKEQAEEIKEDTVSLLEDHTVHYFPDSFLFGGGSSQINHETTKQRLATLESIQSGQLRLIIADCNALFKRLPTPNEYYKKKLSLKVGEQIEFELILDELISLGFSRESRVEHPGELCVRGGIIDVFPHASEMPYRIEFWGDEIESMRSFDPASQRSTEIVDSLTFYPQKFEEDETSASARASLLDYLSSDAIIVVDDIELVKQHLIDNLSTRLRGSDDDDLVGQTVLKALNQLERFKVIEIVPFGQKDKYIIDFLGKSPISFGGKLKDFQDYCEKVSFSGLSGQPEAPTIKFSCDSESQKERLTDIFDDEGIQLSNLNIIPLGLHRGFVFADANLIVYTDHEFYGRVKRLRLPKDRFKGITPRELRHLNIGDYIVHVDYGIGVFRGLKKVDIHGHERECLQIEYRDKDMVYVRIERMDRVTKFSSKNGSAPKLNRLGAADWQKAKARTKKKIKDIANELIDLYAKRKSQPGYKFGPDTLWQRELEASFPYDDTPDQVKATIEVKRDLETARPMDRLICGDVGFGKTEIAVRAAFKAVEGGKQVAVLVPTTILAYQHFNTFCERLSSFPMKVEMLSRFRTKAEQKEIVKKINSGEVDIIIGTHRLFSKDIQFKDLGLLIIDEEHRFGVTHKEKLKRFRINIDVLTLTATPIPRTLQFSLLGARDMTHIATPPLNRLPIITEILPFNKNYTREIILREMDRDGQIFFVHNHVRSIERIARMLGELVPEADIGVAHGQMGEKELEGIMVGFVNKEYDILVSTMIIESGLDMPNVNTIIVNRADKLGLAQLYQLRGRVGRSSQRAYAYFIVPPTERLTVDALKRLRAIEEFSDIGSGSQLAMRDLEIRGSGNLLGAEQTGFIDTLGFDLYNKMVDQTVKELKAEKQLEQVKKNEVDTLVEINFDAFLPEDYVSSSSDRVDIYRRLTESSQIIEINEIKDELEDRFGRMPEPAENLLNFIKVRMVSSKLGLKSVTVGGTEMTARFSPDFVKLKGEQFKNWLGSIVSGSDQHFEFFQNEDIGLRYPIPDGAPLKHSTIFLESLAMADRSE